MTVTKAKLAEAISNQLGLTQQESTKVIESILEILKQTLASGEDVMLSGFGKFNVKAKTERRGRNPATGDHLMLGARRVVSFKCSNKLREKLNPDQ